MTRSEILAHEEVTRDGDDLFAENENIVADFTGPCAVISRYRLEAYATLLLGLADFDRNVDFSWVQK
ncbi:MAG TPA: hypothetical protein VGF37_00350 [Chthoniobacterales bacterium]